MTLQQLQKATSDAEARVRVLTEQEQHLGALIAEKTGQYDGYARAVTILTGLSDSELTAFCKALTDVANQIIHTTFGTGYEISIVPVGTTGMRVMVKEGELYDTVDDSQGEGFKSIVSLALLLAANAISPVVKSGFICFDEPFPGVRGEERLRKLYTWLREASGVLGIQMIVVSLHEAAAEVADKVIDLGDEAA